MIFSLAGLTEWRDPQTGRHLERARRYAVVLAKQLGRNPAYRHRINDEFIDDLYYAAPLHDIGKVGVADAVLLKNGKLTEEEYDKIKEHVKIGARVLGSVIDKFELKPSFFIMAKNICAYHHERFDGTGYPDGLKGDGIPLAVRIFSLCDVYDAIRSERPFKKEIPHDEVVRLIKAERGKQFDPDVVDAFLQCEGEFARVSEQPL
jgi:putative two-component system response regulator